MEKKKSMMLLTILKKTRCTGGLIRLKNFLVLLNITIPEFTHRQVLFLSF